MAVPASGAVEQTLIDAILPTTATRRHILLSDYAKGSVDSAGNPRRTSMPRAGLASA